MKINTNDLRFHRHSWAEINLEYLHSNFLKLRQLAGSASILAVVKSDAYGHGATVIAKELEAAGAEFFGTATVEEAMTLRDSGISTPILILSGMLPEQVPLLEQYDFVPSVYNGEMMRAFDDYVKATKRKIRVHLKVDTGMGRLGFSLDEATEALKRPWHFNIEGVFTHFATAEVSDDSYTKEQIRKFQEFLTRNRLQPRWIHACNSAGLLNFPDAHFNLVRPGLLLYGISPVESEMGKFHPILSLKSKIVFLNRLSKGETIGYGRTFKAQRDSLIATIPIGYSDGFRRALSNRLDVEVCGELCRIVGTISMDLAMIDVTSVADRVKLYDQVTLIGSRTPATKWAELLGTIPYEITCLIGPRIPRVYYKNSKVVDVYYP